MERKKKLIQLEGATIASLQIGANKKGWSLKKYMESVLIDKAKKINSDIMVASSWKKSRK